MDIDLDLTMASRETLLAVIDELKAINAQLQQPVAALEGRFNTRGSPTLLVDNKHRARSQLKRQAYIGQSFRSDATISWVTFD